MTIENTLIGFAIGDAFGSGVEFQDRNWIKAHVDFSKFVNARHLIVHKDVDFAKNYRVWDYSDDTEMLVGVINAYISGNVFTEDLLVKSWKDEYQKGKTEKGFGRNGHGSISWYFDGKQSIEDIRAFQKNREYPGNAPAMRAIPIGFLPSELIDYHAIINADATHPHPKARAASMLIAHATAFLIVKKGHQKDLIAYCKNLVENIDAETVEHLQQIDNLPIPSELTDADYSVLCGQQPIVEPRFLAGICGLPSDALLTGCAGLYILKHSKSAFEGLKNAILLGGDVDTLAGICCGILSGCFGLDSIPTFMLENVEGKAYLSKKAAQFSAFLENRLI